MYPCVSVPDIPSVTESEGFLLSVQKFHKACCAWVEGAKVCSLLRGISSIASIALRKALYICFI